MMTFDEQVHADVQRTLEEDVGTGDLTAALIPAVLVVIASGVTLSRKNREPVA